MLRVSITGVARWRSRFAAAFFLSASMLAGINPPHLPTRVAADEQQPKTVDVRWENGPVELAGTIFLPNGSGQHPAIVFIHGSGDATRSDIIQRMYAGRLARAGIAVLMYDKRGCGESTGDWHQADFDALARDALGGVALLAGRPDVLPDHIGVLGTSQGGWVAPLAASMSESVAFVVLTSAPPISPAEQELYEVEANLRANGVTGSELAEALDLVKLKHQFLRTGDAAEQLAVAIEAARDKPWFEHGGVSAVPDTANWSWNWYRAVMDFDPLPLLERLQVPMLAVYGERDPLVPGPSSAGILERIKRAHDRDFEITVIPAAVHNLSVPGSPWPTTFWERSEAWLRTKAFPGD